VENPMSNALEQSFSTDVSFRFCAHVVRSILDGRDSQ
jgi:hypothetical protein